MLSISDVATLIQEPSPNAREKIAIKVAEYFNSGTFSPTEEKIIQEIFNILVKDVAVQVRAALSYTLKCNANLSHAIVRKLALDIEEVALPILEFSEVLTDDDLMEIIRSAREIAKLLAISRRSNLSEKISSALLNTAHKDIVLTVVANTTANIQEQALFNILILFESEQHILKSMVNRTNLPMTIVNKLVAIVSDNLKETLINNYDIDLEVINSVIGDSREKVITDMLASTNEIQNTIKLIHQLQRKNQLTSSIVLRSLCTGGFTFFETALSILLDSPLEKIHAILWSHDPKGFKLLFQNAHLPLEAFDDVKVILDFILEEANAKETKEERVPQRIIAEGLKYNVTVRDAAARIQQICLKSSLS